MTKIQIIDMHCDTLIEGWRHWEETFYDGNRSINLKLLKENGSMAQFFAMYLSRNEMKTMDSYDLLKEIYGYYIKSMEEYQEIIKPAFTATDIKKNSELGMIIDTAHMSEGGFYDVAKHSKQPFAATHSCARALCNHRRNLTDDQLKTLGDTGGIVGVNFERSFLREGSDRATFDQIIRHLLYMKDKAGIEAVGFGSDFDGIDDNGELVDYSGFAPLVAGMEKHFTDDEIDKVCKGNVLRVIRAVTGK